MNYHILPTGARMFDACHAYGLGVLLAHITQQPVEIMQTSAGYCLSTRQHPIIQADLDTVRAILSLPTADDIANTSVNSDTKALSLGNLDGLLAVTFTMPGVRIISVADATNKQKVRPDIWEQAVNKARAAVERIVAYIAHLCVLDPHTLTTLLVTAYASDQPVQPIITVKRKNTLSIPMTIDPVVGFSTRHPLSDGRITDNVNLTVENPPLAVPLAYIGAARFLRAQRCSNSLVTIYVPILHKITIDTTTSLPLLPGLSCPAEQALAARWLMYAEQQSAIAEWYALAYHTLQTQGAQQSITHETGRLDYTWIKTMQNKVGHPLFAYWRFVLHQTRKSVPFEVDSLVSCLLHRSGQDWYQHLLDVARAFIQHPEEKCWRYTDQHVMEIIHMMTTPDTIPLRVVLANERGTKRFGHALRQLGRYNPSLLRDLESDLDAVHDADSLIRVLAQIVQTCVVMKAKSEFMIIPDDEDLDILLANIEQFGAKRIASLLLVLAVLNYARENKSEDALAQQQNGTSFQVQVINVNRHNMFVSYVTMQTTAGTDTSDTQTDTQHDENDTNDHKADAVIPEHEEKEPV